MPSLQFLSWTCCATLFLILCLHPGICDDKEKSLITLHVTTEILPDANYNAIVRSTATTDFDGCMAAHMYLLNLSRQHVERTFYTIFNVCICKNTYKSGLWKFTIHKVMAVAVVVRIIQNIDTCRGKAYLPKKNRSTYELRYIYPK